MKEILKITEQSRVDTEDEAKSVIAEETETARQKGYRLTKTESKYRTKKSKGEVIEEWYVVTIEKNFAE